MDKLPAAKESPGLHPIVDRIPRVRQALDQLGFKCLDNTWNGYFARYRLLCPQGHEFLRTLQTLGPTSEINCPHCVAHSKWIRLSELAAAAGIRCLETQWLGGTTPHRFECEHKHVWTRPGVRAFYSIGCPSCGRSPNYQRRLSASWQRLQKVVAGHGGQLLTTENNYLGSNFPCSFRCAAGHEWQAKGTDVARRTWCPECARLRKVNGYRLQDGLESLHAKANARGGLCLSDTYEGTDAKYRFRCDSGHEWETTGNRLRRGAWCPRCAYDNKRLTLEDAHENARARGGQCLSTAYMRTTEKLHWLCDRGHSWHAPLASVRAGHWCSECAHMAKITNPKSKAWKRYKAVPL